MERGKDLFKRFVDAEGKVSIIEDLIAEGQSEEMLLDYKQSSMPIEHKKAWRWRLKELCEIGLWIWKYRWWDYYLKGKV